MRIGPQLPNLDPTRQGQAVRRQYGAHTPHSKKTDAPTTVTISPLARDMAKAAALLEQAETARPDQVERGRDLMQNWQGLNDQQLDKIAGSLLDEL